MEQLAELADSLQLVNAVTTAASSAQPTNLYNEMERQLQKLLK